MKSHSTATPMATSMGARFKIRLPIVFTAAALSVLPAYAGAINSNDLLIFQVGDSTTTPSSTESGVLGGVGASPIYIQEIDPTLTSQTTPVQSFSISTNATTSLWSSNNGSEGLLNLSNNNTLLTFGSWVGQNATESNILTRGFGSIDASGNYTQLPTADNYTATATNSQLRAAYSPDGTTYYGSDKTGLYQSGASTALTTTNIRGLHAYGGVTYGLQQSSSAPLISTVSISGSTATLTGLTGIGTDNNANDFVLISSGVNGSSYDTLFVADSGSSAKLHKYALIGGTWTAEGTSATIANLDSVTGAVDANGHFKLYLTVDPGTTSAGGFVETMTDTSAYNATISLGTAQTLYTAPNGDLIQGVSFAPIPEPSTWATVIGGLGMLVGGRALRRKLVR